ncbi:MAG: HAMP domain-containing sensor histidine kinase [Pseudomonadota bacterium]|nr:HAMP domain-containing sensor histidine kinase [Pseudomonadota bacterium]
MKRKSLVSYVKKLALSWTVAAMLLTLILSASLFFAMIYKDAEREIQTLASTAVTSYRTDILSGNIRSIELQLNKEFSITKDEQLLFLDTNKSPWIADLRAIKIESCNNPNGVCRNISAGKIILDMPIYFDGDRNNKWGYIHIERTPKANWPLIFSVTLVMIFGMSFQAFGFYFNLLKAVRSVSETIGNWAKKLSDNPKAPTVYDSAPFTEMEPIENALAGLRREIDILERLAREQGALNTLRGIGHDILNPVSRLKRLLGLIQIKMSNSESFDRDLFQNCNLNLKRLSSYAEQLKILYKKQSGEVLAIDTSALDISKELQILAKEIASDPEAIDKKISIRTNTSDGCIAQLPAPILGRIVENIVANSIHASSENSIITISSGVANENIILEIVDQGSGIPDNIKDRIFEADFSTKINKGTGLGLFVVKQLCEQYKGQISVNSKINSGTTVRILFPRCGVVL